MTEPINSGSSGGDGIFLSPGENELPSYKVVVKNIEVRRGLNGINVSSKNKLGVTTNSYFTIDINDDDDILSTNDDLSVNAIAAVPKTSNPTYPVLHRAHVFGEFTDASQEMGMVSNGGTEAAFELPRNDDRFGRFQPRILYC